MRVLSLGAGVQSSTLLLMACEGEEHIDRAVFADTQAEPQRVYDWLDQLTAIADARGIPVMRVSAGSLEQHVLHGKHAPSLPVFTMGEDGKGGILGRQCTRDYKVRPIRRYLQSVRNGGVVEMLMGISLDEYQRARTSDVGYIVNRFPLIDKRMTRGDCVAWLARHGYPEPPKSACYFCPYHSDRAWRAMRDSDPSSWERAVSFDQQVRDRRNSFRGSVYLHPSLKPLSEVDLSTPQDRGQLDMFEDTDGCGVLCASEGVA